MKTYKIIPKGGKVAASLTMRCQPGKVGEHFLRNGGTQELFNDMIGKMAYAYAEKKIPLEKLVEDMQAIGGGNASQARQAIGDCVLEPDDNSDVAHSAAGGKWLATFKVKSGEGKLAVEKEEVRSISLPADGKLPEGAKRVELLVSAYWVANGKAAKAPSTAALDV